MNCPKCGCAFSKVIDSRIVDHGKKRRRECVGCGTRYNCIEVFEEDYKKTMIAIDKIKKALEENKC